MCIRDRRYVEHLRKAAFEAFGATSDFVCLLLIEKALRRQETKGESRMALELLRLRALARLRDHERIEVLTEDFAPRLREVLAVRSSDNETRLALILVLLLASKAKLHLQKPDEFSPCTLR
eukprot:TRINITY_DN1192_c0_g1_i8.p1 TRINITY_DN1192_c0_g1~~TRINITY_DN1192_c0_g1_i8.p1  ORF type:complete len:121 (+),score=23.02 TRINITY_DN1192_c0_g1_i8:65-427(+)